MCSHVAMKHQSHTKYWHEPKCPVTSNPVGRKDIIEAGKAGITALESFWRYIVFKVIPACIVDMGKGRHLLVCCGTSFLKLHTRDYTFCIHVCGSSFIFLRHSDSADQNASKTSRRSVTQEKQGGPKHSERHQGKSWQWWVAPLQCHCLIVFYHFVICFIS